MSDIALRLLKLEQRFESYCTLHEEELREIKATLSQLRKDILSLHRDLETGLDKDDEDDLAAVPDDDVSGEGVPDSSPVLTL